MTEIKNVLLIGRTGGGKSTLANVLVNKEDNFNKAQKFEEVFKESDGSTSETREIKKKEFEINGEKFQVIDTIGFGDTKLSKAEVFYKIAKVYDIIKQDGLVRILFVAGG